MSAALENLRNIEKDCITPAQAAEVLGCSPQYLRVTAREAPERLGFPVTCLKTRVRIPRVPFLKYMEGGGT